MGLKEILMTSVITPQSTGKNPGSIGSVPTWLKNCRLGRLNKLRMAMDAIIVFI